MDTLAPESPESTLPDIAKQAIKTHCTTLNWVGMNNIVLPIFLETDSEPKALETQVQICVNLNNPSIKGIHMSRLYLLLTDFAKTHTLSTQSMTRFLTDILESHQDISTAAKVNFQFRYLLNQPALKSQYSGWKGYQASLQVLLTEGKTDLEMAVEVPYSSTCPCSAALARQKLQQKFNADFSSQESVSKNDISEWLRSENGTYATPHSQRSHAKVKVKLTNDTETFDFSALISAIEETLKTPVQTAVKREDEQAFAELNGQNLMFCEDAARRLKARLEEDANYSDYALRVEHYESLHAHDAVSSAVKGIAGGYSDYL